MLAHLDRKIALSPRTLAAHLGVAPSTLSAAIARLAELGYLKSDASTSDKRQRELRLTSLGEEAVAATSVLDRDRVGALVSKLTPTEGKAAARGLALLARAARQLEKKL